MKYSNEEENTLSPYFPDEDDIFDGDYEDYFDDDDE